MISKDMAGKSPNSLEGFDLKNPWIIAGWEILEPADDTGRSRSNGLPLQVVLKMRGRSNGVLWLPVGRRQLCRAPLESGLQISMRKVKTTWGWKAGPCGEGKRKRGDTKSAKTCWFGSQSDLEVQVFHGLVFSMCLSQVSYWWPTWNWLCMLPGSLWAIPQKVQDTCGQW